MLSEILQELGRTPTIGFADGTGKVMRFCETTLKSDFGNGKLRTEQEFLSTLHNMIRQIFFKMDSRFAKKELRQVFFMISKAVGKLLYLVCTILVIF